MKIFKCPLIVVAVLGLKKKKKSARREGSRAIKKGRQGQALRQPLRVESRKRDCHHLAARTTSSPLPKAIQQLTQQRQYPQGTVLQA